MVYLMKEDHIAAMKAFEAHGMYCDGDTAPALRNLLQAFDEEDGEAAKEIINSKGIKNLDVDFARLAKHIPLPDSGGLEAAAAKLGKERMAVAEAEKATKAASAPTAAAQVAKEEKALEENKPVVDDSDEDDLC